MRRVIALAAALGWASPAIGDDGHAVDLPKGTQTKSDGLSGRAAARAQRLRAFAFDWQGTPYLWGGNTKHGTDCSGYLREMFRRIYDLELPRTTRDQIQVGVPVSIEPRNLGRGFQPGDLFFYVDRTGTPNHVVTYIGNGQFTHSASGRGVVVEGFKALWGRRIVGRRVLVPASRAEGYALGPIEAAGPIDAQEIPCPPSIRALPHEVRRYRLEALGDLKSLGSREICEWRALKTALEAQPGPASTRNAQRIDAQIEWLESIEALKEQISLE